jgi:nucleotide-binding universal stress UspA family protein
MFDKIVLATDLSPAWDEIVSCGAELRALGCSQVILTHVITSEFFVGLAEGLQEEAKPRLEAQKQLLEIHGLEVIVEMPLGLPGFSLNEVADRYCASLIVVGSHGKSLWRENVLGSIASAVIHNTRYPVLLLKVKVKKGENRATCRFPGNELLRHILFPTDFSATAGRALDYVEKLAARGMSEVTLLHSVTAPGAEAIASEGREGGKATPRQCLEDVMLHLKRAGVEKVHAQLSSGPPLTIIEGAWLTGNFSLIVLGTHGKGFIKEIFLGSVANNVARLAPCPVLLIPAQSC